MEKSCHPVFQCYEILWTESWLFEFSFHFCSPPYYITLKLKNNKDKNNAIQWLADWPYNNWQMPSLLKKKINLLLNFVYTKGYLHMDLSSCVEVTRLEKVWEMVCKNSWEETRLASVFVHMTGRRTYSSYFYHLEKVNSGKYMYFVYTLNKSKG